MVYLLNEDGNRYLKGRRFMPGNDIVKKLKDNLENFNGSKEDSGYDRLRNLIDMVDNCGGIEYNEMKRLKNWFDNNRMAKKTNEYNLIGGEMMDLWINNKLKSAQIAAASLSKSHKFADDVQMKDMKFKPLQKTNGGNKTVMAYLKELN